MASESASALAPGSVIWPTIKRHFGRGLWINAFGQPFDWSEKNLVNRAPHLTQVKEMVGARRMLAFRPNPVRDSAGNVTETCYFTGTHCPEMLWPNEKGIHFAEKGEATFLRRGDCYFMPTGDCPTCVVSFGDTTDRKVFVAHCGVFSVVDPWEVEQLFPPEHRKIVCRRMTPGVLHHGLSAFGIAERQHAEALIFCGIKGRSYRFHREHVGEEFFARKLALARLLVEIPEKKYRCIYRVDGEDIPAAAYTDDVVELRPDIITACALVHLGLSPSNIEIDDVDTHSDQNPDETYTWHSNARDGSLAGRNGIFVSRM